MYGKKTSGQAKYQNELSQVGMQPACKSPTNKGISKADYQ